MFSMKDIAQLIGHTSGVTNLDIHIVVRVAIYPVVDAAVFDVVFQLYRESSIGMAVGKPWALHLERWNMMGHDNLFARLTV